MREQEYSIMGRLPWFSTDAMSNYTPSDIDSIEEQTQCLNCPYAECTNCHCKDKTTMAVDRCEELLMQHVSVKQICTIMKISRKTFYQYKAVCAI